VSYSYRQAERRYPITGACVVVAATIERALAIVREQITHDELTVHGIQRLARGQGEVLIDPLIAKEVDVG
jgi:hypothetical protein